MMSESGTRSATTVRVVAAVMVLFSATGKCFIVAEAGSDPGSRYK